MNNPIKIAVDAMGGENSPKKIIDGIKLSLEKNNNLTFSLYGKENEIKKAIGKNSLLNKNCQIINVHEVIKDDESPLAAAKRGKETSMWKAIESQKKINLI